MNDSPPLSGLAKQLVLAELLDEKPAQQAQIQAQRNKLSLVTYLVQNKLVKSRVLAELASEQFGVSFLDLNAIDKESQPRELVTEKLVRQHRVLPLWRRGNKLFVAVSDPTNHQAVTDIQFSTGLTTESILVEDDKLGDAIDKFFDTATSGMDDLADVDLDGLDVEAVNDDADTPGEGNSADDAPVVRFVNKMLLDAIKGGSSDLHFEPYEKAYRVRFRTDGILHEIARPPIQLSPRISARLKVMAGLDISERRIPQDGRFQVKVQGKRIDLRVSTLPTLFGENVVMRLLDVTSVSLGLDQLGMREAMRETFEKLIRNLCGLW